MSLADFGSIKIVLRDLLEKNKNDLLSEDYIDIHFNCILEKISYYLSKEQYFFLFDWILETIKKENELNQKIIQNNLKEGNDQKRVLDTIIMKLHSIHTKIIEMVIDEIHVSYMDYIDLRNIDEFDLAIQCKISTLGLANSFLLFLTENRHINEFIFDSYIELISQTFQVFG